MHALWKYNLGVKEQKSLGERIAMAVPMAHYSSIVLKYTCVFMYPRSVMIDVPSKASGLWGWQI